MSSDRHARVGFDKCSIRATRLLTLAHRALLAQRVGENSLAYTSITFAVVAGVAEVTLNAPEKLNAISGLMVAELRDAAAQVEHDPAIRAVLLKGAGRAFSAGADLTDPKVQDPAILKDQFNPLILALSDLGVPIVAAVHGAVAGVASSIALMADIVIAGRSAYFLQAFTRIGLAPDGGATWLLPRLIGPARASAMMLLADRIGAEQAYQWGLIYDVVDDAELEQKARAIAHRLADGPTKALAITRRGIRASLQQTLPEALEREILDQFAAKDTDDHREALSAFFEKRTPNFTGR